MITIHKYVFKIEDNFKLEMPKNAKILTVQMQNRKPCIWALVNTDNDFVPKEFWFRGTGHNCDEIQGMLYVGTVQLENLGLVFHLFTR